jgi:hypothetical protein
MARDPWSLSTEIDLQKLQEKEKEKEKEKENSIK